MLASSGGSPSFIQSISAGCGPVGAVVMIDPAGRQMCRKRAKRQAIIAIAQDAFLDGGFAATAMSHISTALGGSKSTLWSYFPSKEALFSAVIEDISQKLLRGIHAELYGADDLKLTLSNFCRTFIVKLISEKAVATWRLVVSESGRFPIVAQVFHQHVVMEVELELTRYFAKHIALGHLRDEDPGKMANFLIDLCTSVRNRCLLNPASPSTKDAREASNSIIIYFFRVFG